MKLFEDGDPFFAPMLNALFAAFRGTAVMSGCEVSATGTSRTVSITAGSVQINGEVIAVSAGSVTLDAGSTFDRYDLVSVNASGSKIVTKGTTKRKCPTQPTNTCLLAIVFVPAGATVIATGNVYDARMLASKVVTDTANVGQLQANSVTTTTVTLIPDPCIWYQDNTFKQTNSTSYTVLKTAKAVPAGFSGTVSVHYDVDTSSCKYTVFVQLRKNGSVIRSHNQGYGDHKEYIDNVAVTPGDVISLAFSATANETGYAKNYQFEIRAVPLPAGTPVLPPW
jgi:hypothetical protein